MLKKQMCIQLATYFLVNKSTIRKTAEAFSISKSSVHNYFNKHLCKIDINLYKQVKKLLNKNRIEKHIRGGLATKLKYQNKNSP